MRPLRAMNGCTAALALLAGAASATAQPSTQPSKATPPSIEAKTAEMQKLDGFVPLCSGLGSNDIGLDRGALAGSRIVSLAFAEPVPLRLGITVDLRIAAALGQ